VCKECGGSGICPHGRRKSQCYDCDDERYRLEADQAESAAALAAAKDRLEAAKADLEAALATALRVAGQLVKAEAT
jgi:hypothetical protein